MEQNLLIVDDELEIVTWLKEMFLYDFDREISVYTAGSGRVALELLNRVKFDVVLTDIHMPQMDGITLFHKVKENWPKCKTVFLTGYQNFDDVYQILRHRDVRYVLKSERDEVIKKAISDAFGDIEKELEEERILRIQNQKLESAKVWMQKNFMQEALIRKPGKERVLQAVRELEIPIDLARNMLVFLLRIDAAENEEWKENLSIQMENLISLLNENMPTRISYYTYTQENRHAFLFIQPKEKSDMDWECLKAVGQETVEYIQDIFKDTYGMTFSAVVKGTPVFLEQLPEVTAWMKQVMVGYVGKNHEMMIQEEFIDREEYEEVSTDIIIKIPMLKSYMELGKQKEYFELLRECTSKMKGKSSHDVYSLEIYYSISTLLLQFINENHIYMELAFKIGLYKLMKVDEYADWIEAEQFLLELSDAVFELLGDKENTLTERALTRIIQYIEDHLSEDLPLKTLAEVGGFNASYLSRLFKQTCDQTITEYICGKRMEKAKKLLAETDNKIQNISSEIGYISAQSFARAFRNYEGVSPVEYRDLHHPYK